MEATEREEMLLTMKRDCAETLQLLDAALAWRCTPEMQNLRQRWESAQEAVSSLLEVFYEAPTKDLDSLIHCVMWFMVVHSVGRNDFKRGVKPLQAPPNTSRIRHGYRLRESLSQQRDSNSEIDGKDEPLAP